MITLWDKFKSAVRFVATDEAAIATMEVTPDPVWTAQPTVSAPNGPPSSPSDGIATQNAVVALLGVGMRTGQPTRHYVTIETFDGAADYTVTVGATAFTENADNTAEMTLDVLASVINASGAPATATMVDGRLVLDTEETVAVSATGTGVMAILGDATAVDLVVWLLSGGEWESPTNGAMSIGRNLGERSIVAGYERVYIEVVATDGEVTPRVGPCLEVL